MDEANKAGTKPKGELLVLALLWGALAVFFAFSDLQISRAVVDRESTLGVLAARYGEIPGLAIISFALFVLHTNRKRRSLVAEVPIWSATIAVSSAVLYYASALFYSHLVGSFDWFTAYGRWVWLALAVVLFALHLTTQSYRFAERTERFARITAAIAILNVVLFVHVFKPLWGRVRFRDLDTNFTDFTPWYLPQGLTGNHSFPSGHTALGWMLLPILVLARDLKRPVRVCVAAALIAWGLFVATGRVVAGAHYASDVLFSTGVAFAAFVFWTRRYRSKAAQPAEVSGQARAHPRENPERRSGAPDT